MIDKKQLISELDSADLFLRNRTSGVPAQLNDFDIMILQDIAKTCDQAARILENYTIVPYNIGDKLYYISVDTGEIEVDTVKFITVTKDGPKPILERHNTRFWNYYTLGVNVFWTEAEAIAAKKKLES